MKSEFIDDRQAQEQADSYLNSSKIFSSSSKALQNAGEDEEIEMVFIQDSPMMTISDSERPRGSFLVFPMRTAYDKLWYGTGAAYFTGLTYGGIYGTYRGLRTAPNSLFKVRLNSIVNQTTRYGPWAANSLGVLTLGWAIIDSAFASLRGKEDYVNHVGAAFTTGFIFKSTAGLRQAFTSGALLSGVVLIYSNIFPSRK